MSEKPVIFDPLSSETRALKSAMTALLDLNQGGGDSEKMLQKAAEQLAKQKVQQTSYDKTKRQRVLKVLMDFENAV